MTTVFPLISHERSSTPTPPSLPKVIPEYRRFKDEEAGMTTSFHPPPSGLSSHDMNGDSNGRHLTGGSGSGSNGGPHGQLQRDAAAALGTAFDPALGSYPSYSNTNSHPSASAYSNSIAPLLHAASTEYNSTNGSGSGKSNGKGKLTEVEDDAAGSRNRNGSGSRSASGGGDEDDNEQDNEHDQGEGEGSKPLKNTKRAAQNRAAQRAFRERKEQYVRDLERKSAMLDETVARERELQTRLALYEQGLTPPSVLGVGVGGMSFPPPFVSSSSSDHITATLSSQEKDKEKERILELERELATLGQTLALERVSHLATKESIGQEKARFDLERNGWNAERDGWKFRENELRRECDGLKGALGECRRVNGDLMGVGSGVGGVRRAGSREDSGAVEEGEAERKRQRV